MISNLVVFLAAFLALSSQSERRTVWQGAFTAEQAARGQTLFETSCMRCHQGNNELVNPQSRLRGEQFLHRWREDNLESLFALVKQTMPRNDPGKLPDQTYVDIISFLLLTNGFPAGNKELALTDLKNIQIEGKDGPAPVPHGALVQLVGCLAQGETAWLLARASEPARTRTPNSSTDEELKAAEPMPIGRMQFRLQGLESVGPNFRPLPNTGMKLHVKGYLVLQPGRERINVTSISVLSAPCS